MAEGRSCRINLAALQQRDPYITNILETASQVALYSFSSKSNEWEKTDIEGTLFVYTRSAIPINGFMILNRLGLNNQIEPITKDLEFQLQDPFLLYKNTSAIYGIWFYDKDECARIGQLMNSLLQVTMDSDKQDKVDPNSRDRHRRASESDTMYDRRGTESRDQVDIMQLLCKAQDEYDKSKGGIGSPKKYGPKPIIDSPNTSVNNLVKPTAIKPEQESNGFKKVLNSGALGLAASGSAAINLETLFGQAQNETIIKPNERQHGGGDSVEQVSSVRAGASPAQSVLDKLMANPCNMLEEIERQQHSQIDRQGTPPYPGTDSSDKINSLSGGGDAGESLYARVNKNHHNFEARDNIDGAVSLFIMGGHSRSPTTKREGLMTPADMAGPSSMSGQNTTILHPIPISASALASGQPPPLSPRKPPSPPVSNVLLSPMAFEKSTSFSGVRVMSLLNHSPSPSVQIPRPDSMLMAFDPIPPMPGLPDPPPPYVTVAANAAACGGTSVSTPDMTPLTREQLQQSLIYLIKNDGDFMKRIHECYVKSLGLS